MTAIGNSGDASSYYSQNATADIARMDSSAVCGNLSDAMKNAILLLPTAEAIETILDRPAEVLNPLDDCE